MVIYDLSSSYIYDYYIYLMRFLLSPTGFNGIVTFIETWNIKIVNPNELLLVWNSI